MARYFEALAGVGIHEAVLVVGYKQDMIRSAVGTGLSGVRARYIVNDQFQRGSITSLWKAGTEFDGDALIMDADVLFHREILRRLVASTCPTALLMDETVKQQTEECMVVVQGGKVAALTKKMPLHYDLAGEGVGFLKIARRDTGNLLASLGTHMDRGEQDMEYEDALLEFFDQTRVGFERIGGLPWVEIDFPEDVVRAEREILPKIG